MVLDIMDMGDIMDMPDTTTDLMDMDTHTGDRYKFKINCMDYLDNTKNNYMDYLDNTKINYMDYKMETK